MLLLSFSVFYWSVWRLAGFRLSSRSFLRPVLPSGPDHCLPACLPQPGSSCALGICSLHPPCCVFLKMSGRLGRVGDLSLCLLPGTCVLGGEPLSPTPPQPLAGTEEACDTLVVLDRGAACGAGLSLCVACLLCLWCVMRRVSPSILCSS